MSNSVVGIKSYKSKQENINEQEFVQSLKNCPIPEDQLLENLGLFLTAKNFNRILFMHHIYQQIISVPGVILDFGTRWGQNLALFSTFRGIYEPFNRHRKLVGFDTFSGFPTVSSQDGNSDLMKIGNISVTEKYISYLVSILDFHESLNPLSHIKKFELVAGDASVQFPEYLRKHPETIVALAYFDFDLYEPTKKCLEILRPRLTKGSVLAFDELNDPDSPGETLALMETVGLNNIRLKRFSQTSRVAYCIFE